MHKDEKYIKDCLNEIANFDIPKDKVQTDIENARKAILNAPIQSNSDKKWRRIMKLNLTKIAAAAVVLIALSLYFSMPVGINSTAYALQDTINVYNCIESIRSKEILYFTNEPVENNMYYKCDQDGNVTHLRFDAENSGEPIGPLVIAGKNDHSEAWLPNHNLLLTGYGNANSLIKFDVKKLNPGYIFQKLEDQNNSGEVILDIIEPDDDNDFITITVTYPPDSITKEWKQVIIVDPKTYLVSKIDKYKLKDGNFDHICSQEYYDYNLPIDDKMFSLDDEVPDNVIKIDMSGIEIGMYQGDMTDQEVATKLLKDFFEAVANRDYKYAGQLYLGAPDFMIKLAFEGAEILKIISIGPAIQNSAPNSKSMVCSCKVLMEYDGNKYILNVNSMNITQIDEHPSRWLACGISTSTTPYTGETIISDQYNPDDVVYTDLTSGIMLDKWLIAGPAAYDMLESNDLPEQELQNTVFDNEYIDTFEFQNDVILIADREYEWKLLKNNDYGIFDLTTKYGEEPQIIYAYAEIIMPEDKHATLGIGSDDAIKVWLNGKLIHQNYAIRGVAVDNDMVPVDLLKGSNTIMIKVQNFGGPWGFCCKYHE